MIHRHLILRSPDAPAQVDKGAPPAPAPAPIPAPAPTPTPSPSPAPAADDKWGALDREIEEAAGPTVEPPPAPAKPDASAAPAKPDAAKPAPTAKPAPAAPDGPKQLRERLAVVERERDEFKSKVADVERLTKELSEARKAGESTAALAQELATAKQEREQARQDLARAQFTPSKEVQAMKKDLFATAESAKQLLETLEVKVGVDPATEQPIMGPAKWDDFTGILTTMKPGPAMKLIRDQFGDNAQLVIQQYWDLKKASDKLYAAEKLDRETFSERVTRETANRETQVQGFKKMIETVESDLVTNNPAEYSEDPKDAEGNKFFQKGMALAQEVTESAKFNALSPQQRAIAIAHTKLKLANYPRLKWRVDRLSAENAKLKEENAALRGGTAPPTAKSGGGENTTPAAETLQQEIERESANWAEK